MVQQKIATKGRGILAMDESNATCGKRLDSIGLENTEDNRRTYRELLLSTPGLGDFISGAILFEETLYQSDRSGKTFVELLNKQNIVPGTLLRAVLQCSFDPRLLSPNPGSFTMIQCCLKCSTTSVSRSGRTGKSLTRERLRASLA